MRRHADKATPSACLAPSNGIAVGLGYVGFAFGLPPNLEWDAIGPRLLRNLGVWFLHYRLRLSEVPKRLTFGQS